MHLTAKFIWLPLIACLAATPAWAECDRPLPAVSAPSESADITRFTSPVIADIQQSADLAWKRPGQPASLDSGHCAAGALAQFTVDPVPTDLPEDALNQGLATVALTYLKARSFASEDQRAGIEQWLIQTADLVGDKAKLPGAPRYWLALGLAAVGIATSSDRHWQQAHAIAEEAANAITPAGTLSTEAAREKPLEAHIAALMPLIALATLARSQGEDVYALGDNALDRLAAYVAKDLAVQPGIKPGAGWSQLYALHAPDSLAAKIPMPRSYAALGGDVQMLVRALEPTEPE